MWMQKKAYTINEIDETINPPNEKRKLEWKHKYERTAFNAPNKMWIRS